jgi:hypothetical protein
LCGTITREISHNIDKIPSEASTPTCEGDAFGTELTKSCKFGSSGLKLASEELLLEVSLRILAEGTHSDPHQSGFLIPDTPDHVEGILVVFCRKPKVPRAPTRRLRWVDGTEARVTTRAEARRRRWRPNHPPKVVAPLRHTAASHWSAKGGALM